MAAAICGAMARAGIFADAQIGAPAQAMTCRRGSSGRVTKPSASAVASNDGTDCGARPMISSARPGAARKPLAPAAAAASASRRNEIASAWPKARLMPQASIPLRNRWTLTGSHDRRGGCSALRLTTRSVIAARNAEAPCFATTSRARASLPCRTKVSRSRRTAVPPSRGTTNPSSLALSPSPPMLTAKIAPLSLASAHNRTSAVR